MITGAIIMAMIAVALLVLTVTTGHHRFWGGLSFLAGVAAVAFYLRAPFWVFAVLIAIAIAAILADLFGWVAGVVTAAVAAVIGILVFTNLGNQVGNQDADLVSSAEATIAASQVCSGTAEVSFTPNEFTQFIEGGLVGDNVLDWDAAIKAEVERNPALVAALAGHFGLTDGILVADTLHESGCWTQEGYALMLQVSGVLASREVSEAAAPSDGVYNTGMDENGNVRLDANAGLRGDLRAVAYTDPVTGDIVFVLVRCGNVVWTGPVPEGVPTGPTDNPVPPCEWNPALPPDSPECVPPVTENPPPATENPPPVCPPATPYGEWPNCKDAPSNDPAPQGNAGNGGGTNQDPGPGQYIPSQQMEQPPAAPYVAPAPPAAVQPAPSTPAPEPEIPVQPAPTPEPSAPPVESPAEGCVPPPGMPDFCG